MKTTLFSLFTVLISLHPASSQQPAAKKELPGRPETKITLDFGDDGKKTMLFPASPYVTPEGWITILAGEAHVIEFDIVDGQPKNLRYVTDKSTKAKPGTGRFEVSLKQDKKATMLMRVAESPKPLAMRCLTQSYGEDTFRETKLNPVDNLPYGDFWPNTVGSAMLGELRFADEAKKEDTKPEPK